jgi:mRNA interferase RelE/StbE
MSWSVKIKRSALKELRRVSKPDRVRIAAAIDGLAKNPYQGTVLKGGLTGLRRIRSGNYRIIFEVRDAELIVLVVAVGHRREVYRRT